MSVAIVHSRALAGIDAPMVTVEVHLAGGLPGVNIVGLPEAEVREARDRVRAALQNAHFEFPARKVTVNLAPADLPKESGRFDLPIALGILAASGTASGAGTRGVRVRRRVGAHWRASRRSVARSRWCCRRDATAARSCCRRRRQPRRRWSATPSCIRRAILLAVCAHLTGQATPARARRGAAGRVAQRPRSRRRPRPGAGQARARDRGRRRAQRCCSSDRPAPASRCSRSACRRCCRRSPRTRRWSRPRSHRSPGRFAPERWRERPFRAPHHTGQRGGAGRRRQPSAARRDLARASRRAVPRRAAGVGSPRARSAARAARVGRHPHFARRAAERVSRAVPARRGDEPLSVRLARRQVGPLPLHAGAGGALSRPRLRAAARSASISRSTCRRCPPTCSRLPDRAARRIVGGRARARDRGAGVQRERQGKPNARLAAPEVATHCHAALGAREAARPRDGAAVAVGARVPPRS